MVILAPLHLLYPPSPPQGMGQGGKRGEVYNFKNKNRGVGGYLTAQYFTVDLYTYENAEMIQRHCLEIWLSARDIALQFQGREVCRCVDKQV